MIRKFVASVLPFETKEDIELPSVGKDQEFESIKSRQRFAKRKIN